MSRTQGTALLGAAVDRFCAGVTASLLHVTEAGDTGVDVSDSDLAGDVAVEAYRIACAFIDSDGRHSDDELLPLIATFGGRFDTQLSGATPGQVRDAALLDGWIGRATCLRSCSAPTAPRVPTTRSATTGTPWGSPTRSSPST